MIIKGLEKSYEVLCLYERNQYLERYRCLELLRKSEVFLLRIVDKAWIAGIISYFMKEVKNKKFTEFEECFLCESALCLVFSRCRGISLCRKLEGEFPVLKERTAMFAAILERLTMQNMNHYFAWDCLKPECIFLTDGLSVSFSHHLNNPTEYVRYDFHDVRVRILELYRTIFQSELKNKTVPALNKFETELEQKDGYDGYMKLYQVFSQVKKQTERGEQERTDKRHTGLGRILKPLKIIVFLFLLLLSITYLIYNIRLTQYAGEKQSIFKSIGTVNMPEEGGEAP